MQSSSRNGAKVIWLAVHTTEGIMRAVDLRAWASWPGSSHASNDETGVLLSGAADGFVDYSQAAWTLRNGNSRSDNLEQCGWARWTRDEWLSRPKLLDTTARWLADRSKARGIPLVKLSPVDVGAGKSGVIGHVDYTLGTGDGSHTDPGPNYPWDVVISKARAYAAGTPQEDELPLTAQDEAQIKQYGGLIEAAAMRAAAQIATATNPWGLDNLRRRLEALSAQVAEADRNDAPSVLTASIVAALPEGKSGGLTVADVEAAIRSVLGGLDTAA